MAEPVNGLLARQPVLNGLLGPARMNPNLQAQGRNALASALRGTPSPFLDPEFYTRDLGPSAANYFSDPENALRALSVAPVPILSDVAGLAADALMYKNKPESRNMLNFGLTGLGVLPLVPAMAGIFAGTGAKTADIVKLNTAKQLADKGESAQSIWEKTGWFKGPEGKWKFEIDDSAAKMDESGNFFGLKGGGGRLNQVMQHKTAFDAYPNTAGINAAYKFDPTVPLPSGSYDGKHNFMRIDNPLGFPETSKSITLHELQHAIQDAEGFAKGGNRNAMEQEWNNARARLNFLESAPDYVIGSKKLDDLWDQVFNKGTLSDAAAVQLEQKILSEHPALKESRQVMQNLRLLGGDKNDTLSVGMDAYKRLAGEAEARAVQSRMNMTPQQRQEVPPWQSYDVPWDKLIIR